jgi:pimeloyl-ACP methyl ester carboxylesterase
MKPLHARRYCAALIALVTSTLSAQESIYVINIPADPPYYRVRYEGSVKAGELVFPVSYTLWIPPEVETLRGLVVHQHGCGEGSCKSGQTGAFDLHWQALARKHDCALLAASYEQPAEADCQLWCDPRNGSARAFQQSLKDLGEQAGHDELSQVPWALWGHSGGGHWCGGMLMLHPERVAAVWLRSGVPALTAVEGKAKPHTIPDSALQVPVMCNLGTEEGVTVMEGRHAALWGGVESLFKSMRSRGGVIGIAVDPLTGHECGNQRYLAIPWFDACLTQRLPDQPGEAMKRIAPEDSWLAPLQPGELNVAPPVPAAEFKGVFEDSVWLPGAAVAQAWVEYVENTQVSDASPPPPPTDVRINGNELTWSATADVQSGLAGFVIERDGKFLAQIPEEPKNPFGRPIFQNLQYSDTPTQPLVRMAYTDTTAVAGDTHQYRVIAINTVGLKSQ